MLNPYILQGFLDEMQKEAVLTPTTALKAMESNNKALQWLGQKGAQLQGIAAKPKNIELANKLNQSSMMGEAFTGATLVGDRLKHMAKAKGFSDLEIASFGLDDIENNPGSALTPAGWAYNKALSALPKVVEYGADLFGSG